MRIESCATQHVLVVLKTRHDTCSRCCCCCCCCCCCWFASCISFGALSLLAPYYWQHCNIVGLEGTCSHTLMVLIFIILSFFCHFFVICMFVWLLEVVIFLSFFCHFFVIFLSFCCHGFAIVISCFVIFLSFFCHFFAAVYLCLCCSAPWLVPFCDSACHNVGTDAPPDAYRAQEVPGACSAFDAAAPPSDFTEETARTRKAEKAAS